MGYQNITSTLYFYFKISFLKVPENLMVFSSIMQIIATALIFVAVLLYIVTDGFDYSIFFIKYATFTKLLDLSIW